MKRISISATIPGDLVAALDALAEKKALTRSALITQILAESLKMSVTRPHPRPHTHPNPEKRR